MSHLEQYRIKLAIVLFIVVTAGVLWALAGSLIAAKVSEPWQMFLVFSGLVAGWIYLAVSLGTVHDILRMRMQRAESMDRVNALLTLSEPRYGPERKRGVSPHDLLP